MAPTASASLPAFFITPATDTASIHSERVLMRPASEPDKVTTPFVTEAVTVSLPPPPAIALFTSIAVEFAPAAPVIMSILSLSALAAAA